MDLWFTENHTKNVRFSMKVDKQIVSTQSKYQRIDIFDTYEFGRMLTLDGFLMVTEKDEFIYHEMIVHVPMAVKPDAKRVLVIGAGDGGTIRELVKYKSIECIDMVEIDEEVVKLSKEYLNFTSCALDDERVNIHFADGLKFVRNVENLYDLIIVDSTDPFGPGESLFTKEFYGNCYKSLTSDGILINQHESPYYTQDAKAMKNAHQKIKSVFSVSRVYQMHIPTYPSGHWLFGFSSKGVDPIKDADFEKWDSLELETRYYNKELHSGAFALPNYVKKMLDE
jgi:spermidine synthase